MRKVPELELAPAVYRAEGKIVGPWLVSRLQACSRFVIAVIESFRKREDIDYPGYAEDDSWDVIAPSPANVEGNVAADDGCEVGTVGNTGGLLVGAT